MLLRQLLDCFDARDKVRAAGVLMLMIVGAGVEAIGIALVFPFIALINNPDLARENRLLAALYAYTAPPSPRHFLIWSGMALIAVYLLKGAYLMLLYYAQYRFIFSRQVKLSSRLFAAYMRSPYATHVQRNSAELLRNINSEVLWIFSGVLVPGASIVIELLVVAAVVTMLMLVEPLPTLVAGAAVAGLAIAVMSPVRSATTSAGRRQQVSNAAMIQTINQGLGAIKEATIMGRQSFFVEAYRRHSAGYARAMLFLRTTSDMPRLGIEALSVAGMLFVIVLFIVRGHAMHLVLPTIGVFVLAAARLMPSLNRIIAGLTLIRYYRPSIELVHRDLIRFESRTADTAPAGARAARLAFDRALELREVSYHYPEAPEPALARVSLVIHRGESVAFVGPSGAGKTTVVNVILGLLSPTSGRVLVDDVDIRDDVGAWQRMVGYIPQPVFLSDDTIRRNVAFGLEDGAIDDAKVWAALRTAQVEEFVRSLPSGLDALAGENGVKMSAGQRQRIGIARALYDDPAVLVLDEATSALDNETEREITRAITRLSGPKTVIIVAHRLTTVRGCDRLFFLKKGELIAAADYDAMLETSPEFQSMVRAAEAAR